MREGTPAETNLRVAEQLRQYADVLERQGANPYRVGAYRRAAEVVAGWERDVGAIDEAGGSVALADLPHVGAGIAAAIHEIVRTGRLSRIERLRGEIDPVERFRTVPGIGRILAERIHDALQIDTLEELQAAAVDGRLAKLAGVGARRAAALRATLAAMLVHGAHPLHAAGAAGGPSVEVLLDVDREYREKARAGELTKIAPRRLNPEGKAWLPVLHATRGERHFTALFSNTELAHRLDRTRDWVVIYYYDGEHREGQHTVVTETHGPLAGLRVVRGREAECAAWYAGDHGSICHDSTRTPAPEE